MTALNNDLVARRTYYVSSRPEAYEVWGEVSKGEALELAREIAHHAAEHFPDVDFAIDENWHTHQAESDIAAYIEDNWIAWCDGMPSLAK